MKMKKIEPLKTHRVEIVVREYDPSVLRFRVQMGEIEGRGKKFEISLCASNTAIYLMNDERQFAIPIPSLVRSVLESVVFQEKNPPCGEREKADGK